VQGEVSGIPKASFVPSELHRQLEEERQLNAQLNEQVRLLQQQLVKAGAAVSKSCSSLSVRGRAGEGRLNVPTQADMRSSMDSVLRGSTVAYQGASDDTAEAQQLEQPLVRLHIQVNAQADAAAAAGVLLSQRQQPGDLSAEGSSSSVAAAMDDADPLSAARLTALQQQVAALQEQLEVVTRDKASLQGRLKHARTVLAAARCSTPSSLNSSRLPSPQPCFSPLRPLYGVSWLQCLDHHLRAAVCLQTRVCQSVVVDCLLVGLSCLLATHWASACVVHLSRVSAHVSQLLCIILKCFVAC
jgi:hypothetical protein